MYSSFPSKSLVKVTSDVTGQIINAAQQTTLQTTGTWPRKYNPWWNKECVPTRTQQKKKLKHGELVRKQRGRFGQRMCPPWAALYQKKRPGIDSTKFKGTAGVSWFPFSTLPLHHWKIRLAFLGSTFILCPDHLTIPIFSFKLLKCLAEQHNLVTMGSNTASYNRPFTQCELEMDLHIIKLAAPGPDGLHYKMLRNLSPKALESLLYFFNSFLEKACFPVAWRRESEAWSWVKIHLCLLVTGRSLYPAALGKHMKHL